jgi:23S rRNA (uracil1939-C5)-methyltransferase
MGKVSKNIVVNDVEIIDTSVEGKAVGKHEGMVIFCEGGVPGDVADINIYRKKKSLAEGKVISLKKPSEYRAEYRVDPPCIHFGVCGGCKWQNMSYQAQLKFKQKFVSDALIRIGKLEIPEILPILGNSDPYFYRNKMEFSFSNKKWLTLEQLQSEEKIEDRNALGFHIPGRFDKVLDVVKCHLQPDPSNDIRNEVRDYAAKNNLTYFDLRDKGGFLRTLMIRITGIGEVMVVVAVYDWLEQELFALLEHLKIKFPQITSLQYVHSHKANDSMDGLEIKTYSGRDYVYEEMEGLKFKISPKSFYQTNSKQAYNLYKITREFAGLKGDELVYDLYTGTGTIANFVAKNCKKVIGVEYVADAVKDANENSKHNNISNTLFFAGDMKDILTHEFVLTHGEPDVIITDPPRAGMHEDVVKVILNASPKKIVYVSCNPSTQARDLALMTEHYKVAKVQPVDMFPQTAHVENVVLLEKK